MKTDNRANPDLWSIDMREGGTRMVLGPLEDQIMQVLWNAGYPLDCAGIQKHLDNMGCRRSITTVGSTVARLVGKGLIGSKDNHARKYVPVFDEYDLSNWIAEQLKQLLETI